MLYYSGHADGDYLRLSGSRLTWVKLRELVRAAESELTITIIDACDSGSAMTSKGASLAPPFEVSVTPVTKGAMWITSSRRAEASWESEELGGRHEEERPRGPEVPGRAHPDERARG